MTSITISMNYVHSEVLWWVLLRCFC